VCTGHADDQTTEKGPVLHARGRMDLQLQKRAQIRFLKRWKEQTPKLTSACQKPHSDHAPRSVNCPLPPY
jgi:hypothetical protein